MKKIFNKILLWWGNTSFCQKKREQWLKKKAEENKKNGLLKELRWPENVYHGDKEDFKESDWVYKSGDRCEHWVAWFFRDFTHRCTVVDREPMHYGDEWVTTYSIREDWCLEPFHNIAQHALSF